MLHNKIVVRYEDGRVLKGDTADFLPTKPNLHLTLADAPPDAPPLEVWVAQLKAIFFVKDLSGSPHWRPHRQDFDPGKPVVGRKIRVVFKDGEVLVGTTQGYDPTRPGFFVIPADTESNNERVFVVKSATQKVAFL